MAIKMKDPKCIWSITLQRTEDLDPNELYTFGLPGENSGVPYFPMGDMVAPIAFQTPLNAVFYAMDFMDVTYHQAVSFVRPVPDIMNPEPFKYMAMPVLTVVTCPKCGAATTEKELRSATAVCPKCGARFPMRTGG